MKHRSYYRQLISFLFTTRRVFSVNNACYKEKYVQQSTSCSSSYLHQNFAERKQQIEPLFKKVLSYENHECIKDNNGQYSYLQLYNKSKILARQISNICGSGSSSTIAIFISNDVLSVLILWACWMSGQLVIPLKFHESLERLSIFTKHYKTKLIITSQIFENCAKQLAFKNDIAMLVINHTFLNMNDQYYELKRVIASPQHNKLLEGVLDNEFYKDSPALMFPSQGDCVKTILLNHQDVCNIIKTSIHSWKITANDRILYITPSYQIFNNEFIFNLLFPLSVGAHVHILQPIDAKNAWRTILGINILQRERVNVLVTEPNVYLQLIQEFDKTFAGDKKMIDYIKNYCQRNIRLMLTCFVNLDPLIFSKWLEISGHSVFEINFSVQMEKFQRQEPNVSNSNLSNIRICIFDANNQLLLDLNQAKDKFRLSDKVTIGRLYVTKFPNEPLSSTGELVCYYRGVLKKIGRYNLLRISI